MKTVIIWMTLFFPYGYWAARDQEVSGAAGRSLTVLCTYSGHLRGNSHYWCKGYYRDFCSVLVQTTGSEEKVKMKHLSIKDYHSTHTFTVTMRAPTEDDSGPYWCGTERFDRDEMSFVQVTILSTGTNFKQTTSSSNLKIATPISLSASPPITATVLPWSVHKEINSTVVAVTASARSQSSPEEKDSTPDTTTTAAGDTQDIASTLSAQIYLLSLVPPALLGMLLVVIVISWVLLRNKKNSFDEEGSHRDVGMGLVNIHLQDMFENPLYDSIEHATAEDGLQFIQ
ncbi:hypothetical protein NDU88_004560 [Pleurodeles waltl]|uniref:Ig-like domain-containing protein n=1 Tax=Pleurodeles waltl TaxID=8319 RepID=A0AAV7T8U5_PLEWA|nr:hypothetical protein NDU88_004560 [Pleurodeles waltl]